MSCRLDDMVPLRYLNSRVMLQDIAPFIAESRELAATGGKLMLKTPMSPSRALARLTFPTEVSIPLLKDVKAQAPNAVCVVGADREQRHGQEFVFLENRRWPAAAASLRQDAGLRVRPD